MAELPAIRNTSGRALAVHGHGDVDPDEVIVVPAHAVYGFTCCANWEPVNRAAESAHDKAAALEAELVAAERAARG